MDYARKIDFALYIIRNIPQDGTIEVSYSGGKDSDVILELAKMAGIPFEAIYKMTSIDPPGTTVHAKEMGATIIRPKKTFLQIIEENSMPSRWSRFCCKYLKEYKVHDRAIQGIRRSESTQRAKLYKEPEDCRVYPTGEKCRVYYPILEWTDEDVARFVQERGIKCHPLYYDEQGNFHPERRLGCIGCPMATDNGRGDFLKYPKLLKQIIKAEQKYLDNHKDGKSYSFFNGSAYNALFKRLFCKTKEDYLGLTDGLLPDANIDTKAFLEDYFHITL